MHEFVYIYIYFAYTLICFASFDKKNHTATAFLMDQCNPILFRFLFFQRTLNIVLILNMVDFILHTHNIILYSLDELVRILGWNIAGNYVVRMLTLFIYVYTHLKCYIRFLVLVKSIFYFNLYVSRLFFSWEIEQIIYIFDLPYNYKGMR